jgi:hypothetical protein
MQEHEHGFDDRAPERPKVGRPEPEDLGPVLRAGAAGRVDAVGPAGVVGLQRVVGNSGVGAMLTEDRSPVHDVVGSGGSPLDQGTRADMEARLGQDFGDVRVHTDGRAHDSAVAVGAHAYTVGSDVVFQRDRYDPGSAEGRVTLAHELTHVVQQRSGPVDGAPAAGGIRVSDPSDRFEREAAATAEQAVAAPLPVAAAASTPAAVGVQRQAAPEEDEGAPVQGPHVQREAEEDREEEPG